VCVPSRRIPRDSRIIELVHTIARRDVKEKTKVSQAHLCIVEEVESMEQRLVCGQCTEARTTRTREGQECQLVREGNYADETDRLRCQFDSTLRPSFTQTDNGSPSSRQKISNFMELQSHLEEWATEDLETYTHHEAVIISLFSARLVFFQKVMLPRCSWSGVTY
jgi:hypothetical protein